MKSKPNSENYIYLHGFASSPLSTKARYFRDRFTNLNRDLIIPDLNQNDFSHLTLTRQLQQVAELFSNCETPITLIGSSFGGLTAAWLGQKYPQIQRLILLAPAFNFYDFWSKQLGINQIKDWKNSGYLEVYHYSFQKNLPLHYQFLTDLQQYLDQDLTRSIPTLILHGREDQTIPIQSSRNYVVQRSWAKLIELESDHSLGNVLSEIWQQVEDFLL